MSVHIMPDSGRTRLAARLAGRLGDALGAEVLGLICQDDHGVFILPQPGSARPLFDYLGGVDWRRAALEASEHFVDP